MTVSCDNDKEVGVLEIVFKVLIGNCQLLKMHPVPWS